MEELSQVAVFAMYGLSPPCQKKAKMDASAGLCEIFSSQEVVSTQEVASSQEDKATPMPQIEGWANDSTDDASSMKFQTEWLDPKEKVLVRVFADGTEVKGKLVAGPNGFAVAKFDCGEEVETECPNLNLASVVMKKPAGSGQTKKRRR